MGAMGTTNSGIWPFPHIAAISSMSDIMLTDIAFQNRQDTLRIAPWLDMPELRKRLQEFFLDKIDPPPNSRYKKCLMDFALGTRSRLPRTSYTMTHAGIIIRGMFPECMDYSEHASVYHIYSHILYHRHWSSEPGDDDESDVSPEIPLSIHDRENGMFENDDDDDYDDNSHGNDDEDEDD